MVPERRAAQGLFERAGDQPLSTLVFSIRGIIKNMEGSISFGVPKGDRAACNLLDVRGRSSLEDPGSIWVESSG